MLFIFASIYSLVWLWSSSSSSSSSFPPSAPLHTCVFSGADEPAGLSNAALNKELWKWDEWSGRSPGEDLKGASVAPEHKPKLFSFYFSLTVAWTLVIMWLCANPANVQEAGVGGRGWWGPSRDLAFVGHGALELGLAAVLLGGTKGAGGCFCVWEGGCQRCCRGVNKGWARIWDEIRSPTHWAPKPHASGFYLSFTSQNISCGFERSVAPVSAAGGNLMMHLFTLCSVVLDPQQDLQTPWCSSHHRHHHYYHYHL